MRSALLKTVYFVALSCVLISPSLVNAQEAGKQNDADLKGPVVVAKRDIEINSTLKPDDFKVEQWPIAITPEDVVTSPEMVSNKVNRFRIAKNSPVYLSDLIPADLICPDAVAIPAGYKVVGIEVNINESVKALIQPGSIIDLFAVNRDRDSKISYIITKVRVFSVAICQEGSQIDEYAIGLLVTEPQSEKIVESQSRGSKFTVVLTGAESLPDSEGDWSSERIARWRTLARQLDDEAAELEDSGHFQTADRLRRAADQLRRAARKALKEQAK